MSFMKPQCDLGPIASPALAVGLLLFSVGVSMAQCPPGSIGTYASVPWDWGGSSQSCYASSYRSPAPRGLLGGRLRRAIRSREVYRSAAVVMTLRASPPVVYAPPVL